MGKFDIKIFKGKKFSNILEEIYENQKSREQQVTGLINELKPLIKEIGDATLIVPLIKEYMDIGIKNDEHLIKMATIIQRSINKEENGEEFGLNEKERQQLLNEAQKLHDKNQDNKDE